VILYISYAPQVGEVDDEGKSVIRVAHDCLMKVSGVEESLV
jgi:hypothetical protein